MNAYVETKIEKDERKMTFWIFIQFFSRDGWTMHNAKVSLGSLKFTLATHRTPSPPILATRHLTALLLRVWRQIPHHHSRQRRVETHRRLGSPAGSSPERHSSLLPARFGGPCAAPPLSPPPEHADSKLVVYVHDLDSDKARLVAKVKIGSCNSDISSSYNEARV